MYERRITTAVRSVLAHPVLDQHPHHFDMTIMRGDMYRGHTHGVPYSLLVRPALDQVPSHHHMALVCRSIERCRVMNIALCIAQTLFLLDVGPRCHQRLHAHQIARVHRRMQR
jgi:hypothetical protein